MLKDKRILLGVTGSIAAYKAALLARLFVAAGAEVRVIMTEAATRFVTPLTFSNLSKHPVTTDLWSGEWTEHIHLASWADILVIAPCTANTLADMATGRGNNALLAIWLAARCPVLVAPAMDAGMYHHPAVQRNIAQLQADGVQVVPPGVGFLASGLNGTGRLAEPEEILAWTIRRLTHPVLQGKSVLITAGPTREPLDPVRYLSNGSTGKMGVALAEAAWFMGATVTLVHGPIEIPAPIGVTAVPVTTASEMLKAVQEHFPVSHLTICSAAVADYKPQQVSESKLKKDDGIPEIRLTLNPDILAWCGSSKLAGQYVVGFALESGDGDRAALSKLEKKNADAIVLNYTGNEGEGIGSATNRVKIFLRNGNVVESGIIPKRTVAELVLTTVLKDYPLLP